MGHGAAPCHGTEHSNGFLSKPIGKRDNKHLMTGSEGNSEFCFPETPLNVSRGEAEGNIEVEGKQNSLFPEEDSH